MYIFFVNRETGQGEVGEALLVPGRLQDAAAEVFPLMVQWIENEGRLTYIPRRRANGMISATKQSAMIRIMPNILK